jgi:hypothetical protein
VYTLRQVHSRWQYFDGTYWFNCKQDDPITDLNAMHEAEKVMKAKGIFSSYLSALAKVCGFDAQGDEAWHKLHAGMEAVASATAAQRAEAFLRTLNLYTNPKPTK